MCGYTEVKLLKCSPKSEHLGFPLNNVDVMLTTRRRGLIARTELVPLPAEDVG